MAITRDAGNYAVLSPFTVLEYDLTFFLTDCHKKVDCFLISDYMIAKNESRLLFENFHTWRVFLSQNKTGEAVSISVSSL